MSRASALYRLQKVDTELDKLLALLSEAEAKLASNPVVQKAQADLLVTQEALTLARRAAKLVDEENKSLSAKVTENEARMYSGTVRNPRELQDLQNDIASLKRKRDGLDEQQLAAIEAVEAAEKSEAAAQAVLAAALSERAEEQGVVLKDKGAVEALIAKVEGEREAALISVNAEDRATYDTLRKQKRIAVSPLSEGVCSLCGVSPSSSRVQLARAGGELVRCNNCGRILYAEQGKGHVDTGDKEDEMIQRW